jgi:hypothetical protein
MRRILGTIGVTLAMVVAIPTAAAGSPILTHYYEPGSVSPFVQGQLDREGSRLSLTAAGTTVELTDFVIDPGAAVLSGTVSVDGEVAASSAPLFFLDGRTLNPLSANDNGTAVLEGTTVAFHEGMTVGIAKITINTSA